MDKIYSEKELVTPGMSWGEWKFSLSEDKLNEKLSSFPRQIDEYDKEEKIMSNLFSILKESSNVQEPIADTTMSVNSVDYTPMEHSPILDTINEESEVENVPENIEALCSSLVDICNRSVPKSREDFHSVQEQTENIVNNLSGLNEEALSSLMASAWSLLHSDESKFCFCISFCSSSIMCQRLCSHILLPWLNEKQCCKIELLSSILSIEGSTVCVNLVAPLLRNQDSPWVRDLPSLEELMNAMTVSHWTLLLKELLSGLSELEEWHIPVLAAVVERAEPTCQDLHVLVQLMSSTGTTFAQHREFGALVVAVANSLKPDCALLGPQLKAIASNFKGALKVLQFKTLKILAEVKE